MKFKELPNGNFGRWFRFVAQTLVIPLCVFVAMMYTDIAVIKSTQWSEQDQKNHEREMMVLLTGKADVAQIPPPVVVQRLNRIEEDIREIRKTLDEIREKMVMEKMR